MEIHPDILQVRAPAIKRLPPDIFNADPGLIPGSIDKALALDLEGVIPNHCDRATPAVHLRRLRHLRNRLSG